MAGPTNSSTTWWGTLGLVLFPGMLVGAAFGLAEHRRRTGGRFSLVLALAPLLFLGTLTEPRIFGALPDTVIGALLLDAGQRRSGVLRHRRWLLTRALAGTVLAAAVPVWVLVAGDLGGPDLRVVTASGARAAVLYRSLLGVLALAASVPHLPRAAVPQPPPVRSSSAIPHASSRSSRRSDSQGTGSPAGGHCCPPTGRNRGTRTDH